MGPITDWWRTVYHAGPTRQSSELSGAPRAAGHANIPSGSAHRQKKKTKKEQKNPKITPSLLQRVRAPNPWGKLGHTPGAHSQWRRGAPEPRLLPRGMLMRSPPSRARSLLRLKVPRRRRTCGRSRSTCCSSSVSSRSNTSSSHCASRCSRLRSCSAWDRCSRAARVSSSSRLSSSYAGHPRRWSQPGTDGLDLNSLPHLVPPLPHSSHLFLSPQFVKEALNLAFPALLHGMEGVPRHLP